MAALLAFGWTVSSLPLVAFGLPEWTILIGQAILFTCIPLGLSLFPDSRIASRWTWLLLAVIPIMVWNIRRMRAEQAGR